MKRMVGKMLFLMRMFLVTIILRDLWVWKCSMVSFNG